MLNDVVKQVGNQVVWGAGADRKPPRKRKAGKVGRMTAKSPDFCLSPRFVVVVASGSGAPCSKTAFRLSSKTAFQ